MGQRSRRDDDITPDFLSICGFATPLGYWAIAGSGKVLYALTLGHANQAAALESLRNRGLPVPIAAATDDWNPLLRRQLERYASGHPEDFRNVPVYLGHLTEFQRSIIDQTRRVAHGTTVSYGELAALAGRPRAARAVGTVMANNCIPIVIPCHRIVASGGRPGGYSAPQGLSLKLRLLEMERGES